MIRPCRFYPNPETAADNSFQQTISTNELPQVSAAAQREFDVAVETLQSAGVMVHVMEDTITPEKPDAVFPNNWISTHHDGRVVIYPMFAALRRLERRHDVIALLRSLYRVTEVIDYSACELRGQSLEGTGSLVLDHVHKLAYVSLSKRAHPAPLARFCQDFGYEAVTFTSIADDGEPIYHTNVMMCISSEFALLGFDSIPDSQERKRVRDRLFASGKQVIELDRHQIANFAGNAIELHNDEGKLLVLSERAASVLSSAQQEAIERHARMIPLALPTIELAGGSARCMMAGIHLPAL